MTSTIQNEHADTGMPRRYAAEAIGTFGIVFAPAALSGAFGLAGISRNARVSL